MVDHLSIGVLGIQGAISEHVLMMKQVMNQYEHGSTVSIIRNKRELEKTNGLIMFVDFSLWVRFQYRHFGLGCCCN